MKTQLLTVLIPVYNEKNCIPSLYKHLLEVAEILPCEIEFLFVNDGSTDSSLSTIRHLQQKDSRISIVDLSRNFGKEKALSAGIDYAKGNTLTILDADLQDPPELIPLIFLKTTSEDGKKFVSFYDKRSKKMISWNYIYYDMDFAVEFMNNIFSYKDYFVALVEPETLKNLKKYIDNTTHYPMKEENRIMIENLRDDDNLVLVFFKIKAL